MSDSDLEELRRKRLAQLQSESKGDGENSQNAQKAKEDQRRAQEDAKNSILSQILDQSARARLNTLRLGKPEKGALVEEMLVRMARQGVISKKIDENELIILLENLNQQHQNKSTVKFDRRRVALDSDDEL